MEYLTTEAAHDIMTKSSSHSAIGSAVGEVTQRKAHRSSSDVRQYSEKRRSRGSTGSFHATSPVKPIVPKKSYTPKTSTDGDYFVFNKSVSVPNQEQHYGTAIMADDNIDPIQEYQNSPINASPNHNNNSPRQNLFYSTTESNVHLMHHQQLAQQQTTNVNTLRTGKIPHRRSLDHERAAMHRENLRERGPSTDRIFYTGTEQDHDDDRDPQYV